MTFQAPPSYAAAKPLMGADIETPIGVMRCSGAGSSGVDGHPSFEFSLHFHAPEGHVAISWSSIEGWVTFAEQKAKRWTKEWDRLPANARKLIADVLGHELDAHPLERRANVAKILRIAKRRLIKAGKLTLKTCGRCGGTGRHSYNQRDGDTCWGCGGTGVVLPTTSECLKANRARSAPTERSA